MPTAFSILTCTDAHTYYYLHTEAEIKCWHNLLIGQISLCRVGMVKQGKDGLNINKVEKYSIPSNNTLDVIFLY